MNLTLVIRQAIAALLCTLFVTGCQAQQPVRPKKLIESGWDFPDPGYIRQNIQEMEKRPFDGIVFHLLRNKESAEVFNKEKWDEAKFAKVFDDCKNIKWQKFTDNFLIVQSASNMDWFSDADWESVLHNIGIVAKAAALARCRGLIFDPEPYGNSPWTYTTQVHASTVSFADYQAKARQRGAQFMRAISQQMPRTVIFCYYLLSLFENNLLIEKDMAKRDRGLPQQPYALFPAFLNGMLDAAGPDITIVDGNEWSYFYTQPLRFDQATRLLKQDALAMVSPENRRKYQSQVQISHALYVDYVFGLGQWAQKETPISRLTQEQRLRLFEQNTYYALRASDEFAWVYSEKMDWWKNINVPAGLEQAIRSARMKVAAGQPLGF